MSKYNDVYIEYELIGRGSYGSAHLVRHKDEQHMYVAKKIMLSTMKQKEQDDARREVTLLQRLKHPHIVQYKESFNENGTLIIIMEYCEEGDLSFHINRKSQRNEHIPEKIIMNWFLQCSLALKYIHEQKTLHRDIKSQNIFLTSNGFVKIGDFGISRVLEHTYDQAHTVVGTPYYMSPEVCENKPYTYKSDVWALGCVLYELCNLTHAFKSNNLLGLVNRIVKDQVSAIPNIYSPQLNELIQKLLQKKADSRPYIQDIFQYPIVRNIMEEFIKCQGVMTLEKMPIKKTNTHNQIDKMIKNEQTMDTVMSIDVSQMTPKQRLQFKKEEEANRRQKELEAAVRSGKSQLTAQQRRQQELQGSSQNSNATKKQQQQEYYEALQQQQTHNQQPNISAFQGNNNNSKYGNSANFDQTLLSQYENTSRMLQNPSTNFKNEMEEFDKTVQSQVCESQVMETTITNSQMDRFTRQQSINVQPTIKKELSVTQQYADEEFEEYVSDEEYEKDQTQLRLTVKAQQSETDEVLKLYQLTMDQTIKKQMHSQLEEIHETSQESWTSSQAQSPVQAKQTTTVQERINNLKKQAITKLGSELFNKLYSFMTHHTQKGTPADQVRKQIEEMVGKQKMNDCMILDEIIWYEMMSK